MQQRESRARGTGACAVLAGLLPAVWGMGAASGWPSWGDDLGIVRGLGFIPVGSEGTLSALLAQLAALLPVGGRCLRASWVGIIALSLASWLLFSLLYALLASRQRFGLNPFLALLASQLWALSPAVQRAAARVGGPSLALLLLLLGLRLARSAARSDDARALPLAGFVLGLTAGESHAAALLGGGLLILEWLCTRPPTSLGAGTEPQRFGPAARGRFVVSFAAAWGLCGLVLALRSFGTHPALELGFDSLPVAPELLRGARANESWQEPGWLIFGYFGDRLGPVALWLALVGGLLSLRRRTLRRRARPFWMLALVGAGVTALAGDTPEAALCGLVASLGLVALAPLTLQAVVCWLWTRPVPFARPAGVLAVSFAITLVLQRADAAPPPGASAELGSALWTERALQDLPPRSLVLARDPTLALRLLSAQLLGAERPDVLTVPLAFLARGSLALHLRAREPRIVPLLRELIIDGGPDEYSLTRLADGRPLFLELDPSWDRRLLDQLRPAGLWLEFATRGFGASERQSGSLESEAALQSLLSDPELDGTPDAVTRRMLGRALGAQALTLAALDDPSDSAALLAALRRVCPDDPLAQELAARLERTERGHVAVNDLLE